jgi:aminotransferase
LDSETFCIELLKRQSVACVPGSAFGPCGEGFIRLSYATSMAQIKAAVQRIDAFVKSI